MAEVAFQERTGNSGWRAVPVARHAQQTVTFICRVHRSGAIRPLPKNTTGARSGALRALRAFRLTRLNASRAR